MLFCLRKDCFSGILIMISLPGKIMAQTTIPEQRNPPKVICGFICNPGRIYNNSWTAFTSGSFPANLVRKYINRPISDYKTTDSISLK